MKFHEACFIMSAIYVSPHIDWRIGVALGAAFLAAGIYALLNNITENKK